MAMEDIMAEIDVDELRDYMEDYCGTAAAAGFDTAVFDLAASTMPTATNCARKPKNSALTWRNS